MLFDISPILSKIVPGNDNLCNYYYQIKCIEFVIVYMPKTKVITIHI